MLRSKGADLWFFMPVPSGFGEAGIPDFIGCYKGRMFAIETKAAGKKPTRLQQMKLDAIAASGGEVFVIAGVSGIDSLAQFLELVS